MEKKDVQPDITLLLVDDEEDFVRVLAKRMSKRGIRATGTGCGTEAIKMLRKEDFDVAVLDLKMKDMDGLEVLKIFKKMCEKMPVIMLTGHGSLEAAKQGMELGAFAYLSKPCEFEELMQKIGEAVA